MNKIKVFLIEEIIAFEAYMLSLFGNDRTNLNQFLAMAMIFG